MMEIITILLVISKNYFILVLLNKQNFTYRLSYVKNNIYEFINNYIINKLFQKNLRII
jgi:hypothetical protein